MRIFTILGILFYTIVFSLIGGIIIGFALHLIQVQDIVNILEYLYHTQQVRFSIGLVGVLLIFISISFAQLILGKMQKEKTIAFSSPAGEVTISLIAIEDLVRRLVLEVEEIREARPDVVVGKKGIEVDLRITLRHETNIPEFTSRLQELIRTKISEVLGVEETILVKIHVSKIITQREEKKKTSSKEEQPAIPFQYEKL